MDTQNLSTLKIHKLTQAQYDRELAAGNIDENALYLTPDEAVDLSGYATVEQLNESVSGAMSATNPVGTGSFSLNRKVDSTIGGNSVAVGNNTTASGYFSFAEGEYTTASGMSAHAEGADTVASGTYSHAEGAETVAEGTCSHAEGYYTTASGECSHAEGNHTTASGECSHAAGHYTTADNYQYVVGKYNASRNPVATVDTVYNASDTVSTTYPALFIIGNGTGDTSRSNAFTVYANGKCKGLSSFGSSGADYARQYEWLDGNPNDEDRRGLLVVLDGSKIRIATSDDDIEDCEGIVSTCPAFVENDPDEWHDRYLKDVFGRRITQEVIIPEETITKSVEKIDEETEKTVIEEVTEVIPEHTIIQFVVNPEYDPEQEYICRDVRPEWTVVGFSGFIVAVDDGTCQVNGYCTTGENGVLTMSETRTAYRVMERKDDNHILVRIK